MVTKSASWNCEKRVLKLEKPEITIFDQWAKNDMLVNNFASGYAVASHSWINCLIKCALLACNNCQSFIGAVDKDGKPIESDLFEKNGVYYHLFLNVPVLCNASRIRREIALMKTKR